VGLYTLSVAPNGQDWASPGIDVRVNPRVDVVSFAPRRGAPKKVHEGAAGRAL
jgi:hypothetical protein